MELKLPLCSNCNGSGTDGGPTPDPLCKGTGRLALAADAPAVEWVRWIREQPDAKHGAAVLEQYLGTLAEADPDKDDDE